jgi:hypothetical protein
MQLPGLYILLLLTSLFWTSATRAETFYPLITYHCDTKANVISITNTMLHGDKGKNFHYSDADGTYSPWQMVDTKKVDGQRKVTHKRKITKICKLSSGEYTVTLDPQTFFDEPGDHCGDTISAAVTIDHVDDEILERRPFEGFCLGNAPIIKQIIVSGKTAEVKIKHIPKYMYY